MTQRRKDINALNDNDVADYIHALNILRARSEQNPDDETGYDFQAGLHNDVFIGPCEHGNDLFFAWHRAHLHYFEKLLQEADPPRTENVTIPYWDWLHVEANGKFPEDFATPGLFMPDRNENLTALPEDTLLIVIEEMDWNVFGGYPKGDPNGDYGRLEIGPHNYMHSFFIGGRMSNPATAAEDPIYFSFHCFIDLLWAEWQRRNDAPPPTSPEADLRGFLEKPKHKVRDFQSTTDLGHEYEYTEQLEEAFEMSLPERGRHELLATESLHPLFADRMESELRNTSRVQFAFPSPPAATAAAVVRLQSLKVPTMGSYMLRAYVHPKDVLFDEDDTESQRRYFVGYAALWQSHEGHKDHGGHEGHSEHHPPEPHHPSSSTVRFNVTESLASLTPEAVSDLVLTLHYIPAPGPTGDPEPVPDLVKEVELNDVLLEAYTQP